MRELFTDYEPDYDLLWQEYVELDEQAVFYATHEQDIYPMTEEHKGLPVHGYQPQSDAKVALVNEFKQDEERLLRKLDGVYDTTEAGMPTYDRRWVAVARTHFQEGFMALNRAVFQPQRISLPEDGE